MVVNLLEHYASWTGVEPVPVTAKITLQPAETWLSTSQWALDHWAVINMAGVDDDLCDLCMSDLDIEHECRELDFGPLTQNSYALGNLLTVGDYDALMICDGCAAKWRELACRRRAVAWFRGNNKDFGEFLKGLAA